MSEKSYDYHCEVCGKGFDLKASVKYHMKRHAKEKEYKCEDCGKGFYVKDELQRHTMVHWRAEQVDFECIGCSQRFPTILALRKHVLHKHGISKECPIKCKYCHAEFTREDTVLLHTYRKHSGKEDHPVREVEPKAPVNFNQFWPLFLSFGQLLAGQNQQEQDSSTVPVPPMAYPISAMLTVNFPLFTPSGLLNLGTSDQSETEVENPEDDNQKESEAEN